MLTISTFAYYPVIMSTIYTYFTETYCSYVPNPPNGTNLLVYNPNPDEKTANDIELRGNNKLWHMIEKQNVLMQCLFPEHKIVGPRAEVLPLQLEVPAGFMNETLSFFLSGNIKPNVVRNTSPKIMLLDSDDIVVLEIELVYPHQLLRLTNRFQVHPVKLVMLKPCNHMQGRTQASSLALSDQEKQTY